MTLLGPTCTCALQSDGVVCPSAPQVNMTSKRPSIWFTVYSHWGADVTKLLIANVTDTQRTQPGSKGHDTCVYVCVRGGGVHGVHLHHSGHKCSYMWACTIFTICANRHDHLVAQVLHRGADKYLSGKHTLLGRTALHQWWQRIAFRTGGALHRRDGMFIWERATTGERQRREKKAMTRTLPSAYRGDVISRALCHHPRTLWHPLRRPGEMERISPPPLWTRL